MRIHKTILSLITAALLFLSSCHREPKATPEELFSEYFTVVIPASVELQPGVAAATLEQQAFRLLDAGNYEQAAILFSELAAVERASGYMLYRGMAQLAADDTQSAINSLQQVRPESDEYDLARWNIALAYLQEDKPTAAKEQLQALIEQTDNTALRQKATELREKL